MSNITQLRGKCPAPFLDTSKFPVDGGFVDGRFCAPLPGTSVECCLPCPVTDWLFPQEFNTYSRVAEGVNLVGFVLCAFLVLSWFVLPTEKTRRHYLSVCLVIGCMVLELGFVVPFAARPEVCYNEITPNDMYSSLPCAWSGAFIVAGGLAMDVWIFIRALSMHLQICWDVLPGKKFFYAAQGIGWGVIAVLFTVTITFTGVSFRFGDACHINSIDSMKDFWGPLLAIAGASTIIQLATFGYCINVYLRNMWSDDKTSTNGSTSNRSAGLPSYTSRRSARAVYRRVRKVLWLQWRGITIVIFILIDVIFFSIIFVYLDTVQNRSLRDVNRIMPFATCLVVNEGKREECFKIGQQAFVNVSTVIAILMMLSIAGIQSFLLLSRWSMITGWIEYFRDKFGRKGEFVSLDARRYSSDARAYELLKVGSLNANSPNPSVAINTAANMSRHSILKSPNPNSGCDSPASPSVTTPADTYSRPRSNTPDYCTQKEMGLPAAGTQSPPRQYRSPVASFSQPRPPSAQGQKRVEWDPRSTHARGGLGLHPPDAHEALREEFDEENQI